MYNKEDSIQTIVVCRPEKNTSEVFGMAGVLCIMEHRGTAQHCRNGQYPFAVIMKRFVRAFPLPRNTPDVLPYLGGIGSFPDAVAAMDNWAHRKKERRNWINLSFTVDIGSPAK